MNHFYKQTVGNFKLIYFLQSFQPCINSKVYFLFPINFNIETLTMHYSQFQLWSFAGSLSHPLADQMRTTEITPSNVQSLPSNEPHTLKHARYLTRSNMEVEVPTSKSRQEPLAFCYIRPLHTLAIVATKWRNLPRNA